MTFNVEQFRQEAASAERTQNWASASRLRDSIVLQQHPAGFWDRLFAIRAAVYAGRIDDALNRLRLLAAVPGTEGAWAMMRAEIEERRGSDADAIEWWQKAATSQSDPYWALFGLARSFVKVGQAANARQAMSRALSCPSAEASGAKFAASLDLRFGQFEEAASKLSRFDIPKDERAQTILASLPGMTSQGERLALYRAAGQATGAGQIVDLGCWLGSLTVALALGLEANDRAIRAGVRIHAYDKFEWVAAYMDASWPPDLPMARPDDGDSFLPAFRLFATPWARVINVHASDLREVRWTSEPIELLSVDAMKSPALAAQIISHFYPALLPGESLLFHQDFCHGYTWWIHVHQFVLRRHFELVDALEGSAGILLRFVQPFLPGELDKVAGVDVRDAGLAAEAFSYSAELAAPADRGTIAAASIRCELDCGRHDRARELMDRYRDDPVVDRELAGVPEWMEARAGAPSLGIRGAGR